VLTQADFDRFAALSGDDNPIHVDAAYAARTRFERTVSHGILLVTILRGLAAHLRPDAALARHEVRFPAPTFAGEPMAFEVWRDSDWVDFVCRREADGVVTCDGRFHLSLHGLGPAQTADGLASGAGGAPAAHSFTPRLRRGALAQAESVGDVAIATRRFSAADLAEYVALGGEAQTGGLVPEPMVSALFSCLLGVELPGPGANYMKQETDFFAPGRLGEALRASVEVTRLRPEKSLVDLATLCTGDEGRPIAAGRALIFVGDRTPVA
jgi:acyl dehydratase